MRAKYKRGLTIIGFLLILTVGLGIAYLLYDKVMSNETEVVVIDELSINYMDGYKIKKVGEYSFSITNNSNKDVHYEIIAKDFSNYVADIKYDLISADAKYNVTNAKMNIDDYILASSVLISPKSTQNFTIKIKDDKEIGFNLEVRKIEDSDEYFYMTILKHNEIKKNTLTKVIEDAATTNEGLIEDVDDLGLTYYFRGNVPNNYVKLGDSLWRIIRINGDNSVKLILNDVVDDLVKYNENSEEYESFEGVTVNEYLKSYYDINLKEFDAYIVNAKYCNESNKTEVNGEMIYNGYTRLITDKIPTFNCLGNVYSSKIGLLTADEIAYAGANFAVENKDYYLHLSDNENIWWTSTLAKAKNNDFYPFSVLADGKLDSASSGLLYKGIRPTINLMRKTKMLGEGTIDNPYILDSNLG